MQIVNDQLSCAWIDRIVVVWIYSEGCLGWFCPGCAFVICFSTFVWRLRIFGFPHFYLHQFIELIRSQFRFCIFEIKINLDCIMFGQIIIEIFGNNLFQLWQPFQHNIMHLRWIESLSLRFSICKRQCQSAIVDYE